MTLIKVKKRGTDNVSGRKNHIINGDFSIAQRATSASSGNGTYVSLDRWKTWAGSAATVFSQQSFTLGQTDVPQTKHYARAVVSANSDAGAYSTLNQHIENVTLSSSQEMTLSFFAKASSAGLKIGIEPIQNFGTGGSPSARVLINGTAKTLTTSWAKYTHTFTFGSISGKTLGTAANSDNFEIGFWLSGGSNYNTRTGSIGNQAGTFEIANVQLENGAQATDMEQRSKAEELALCQRYHYRRDIGIYDIVAIGHALGDRGGYVLHTPVLMRAKPSVSQGSHIHCWYNNAGSVTAQNNLVVGYMATGQTNANQFYLRADSNSTVQTGYGLGLTMYHGSVTSSHIALDSEL